jgi:hypothetical protein
MFPEIMLSKTSLLLVPIIGLAPVGAFIIICAAAGSFFRGKAGNYIAFPPALAETKLKNKRFPISNIETFI